MENKRVIFYLAADRAKAIKTKAVINESPTDKLIRELREENARLMEQLKKGGGGPSGDTGRRLSGHYSCSKTPQQHRAIPKCL